MAPLGLQGLYLELEGLTESLSESQVPSGGRVAFKLHYFQVDTAPVVFVS